MSIGATLLDARFRGKPTIRLHPNDNVVVATARLAKGTTLTDESITILEDAPFGHKIATTEIAAGAAVRKYGQVIGVATEAIPAGRHVHTHNLTVSDLRVDAGASAAWSRNEPLRSFMGYRRANGRVGVRNYIGVLTSVNCSATVARHIAEATEKQGLLSAFPGVDGVVPITHGSGCGMASSGEGFELLKRTLWGTAANPNFGAVMLVGLGCEVLQIGQLKADYGLTAGEAFQSFTIQETGGTRRAIDEGLARLEAMLPAVNAQMRTTTPASALMLGL